MDIQTFISFAEELRRIAVAEARRCIPDAEDVEDVAKETILRIWERRDILTPELTKLRKYSSKVARNVSEDCYIVSEDMLALEDGSETSEGQWLMFRYLDKKNPFQQWKLIEENGVVTIVNKATGRCVDLAGGDSKEGAAVFSYDINTDPRSNANQKWMIEEVE